jgi:hypothetical protein
VEAAVAIRSLTSFDTRSPLVPASHDSRDDDLVPPASSSVERDEIVRRFAILRQETLDPAALAAGCYPNDRLDQLVIDWQFGVR